jgi:sulfur-oxidizing protein SoxZ
MPAIQPRIQAPDTVGKGEIFEVRTLINHPMETGLRKTDSGHPIPRDILYRFICRYNGMEVFKADLHEAMAENPYFSFYVKAASSGKLQLVWEEDGGAIVTLEKPLTVEG